MHEPYQALADLVTEAFRLPQRCDDLLPLTLPMSLRIAQAKGIGHDGRYSGVFYCAACKGQVSFEFNERTDALYTHRIPVHGCTCAAPRTTTMPSPDDIPYNAIEVVQRGDWDKARWCSEQGEHTWDRVESDDPRDANKFHCETCGAEGDLVRPLGARVGG